MWGEEKIISICILHYILRLKLGNYLLTIISHQSNRIGKACLKPAKGYTAKTVHTQYHQYQLSHQFAKLCLLIKIIYYKDKKDIQQEMCT